MEETNYQQKLDDYEACIKEFAKIRNVNFDTMKSYLDVVVGRVATF